jgi:outer membrane protein
MQRINYFFFFLSFCLLRTIAQDTTTFSLQKCIDFAIKNNISLKQAEFQKRRSGSNLEVARASSLPYASAYAQQGINQGKSINPYTNTFINQQIVTGQYGVNAGLTLWSGFSTLNTMRQNSFNYEASKMDVEQARMDLIINVTLAYLQVLSYEEQLTLSASQVNVSKEQVRRLETLNKSKAADPAILFDTRGQLGNDELFYINTKTLLESSKISLAQLMNFPDPSNLKLEKINVEAEFKTYPAKSEEIFSYASKEMPSVRSARLRSRSSKRGLLSAYGQLFPTLSLNGSLGTNYSDAALSQKIIDVSDAATDHYVVVNNSPVPVYGPQYNFSSEKINFNDQFKNNLNSYVGLSLQIPIFNALRLKNQVTQSKINRDQALVLEQTTHTQLKLAVEQAYTNTTASFERYSILTEQAKNYGESFRIALSKFEAGALNSVEFMIAKNNSDRAALNLIAAKYDYALKSKILDYYSGKGSGF